MTLPAAFDTVLPLMPKRRAVKNWYRIPLLLLVILLLIALGYRSYRRWGPRLFARGPRPAPRLAAQQFCGRVAKWSGADFVVKRATGQLAAALVISDYRGGPLVLTNLDLSRAAEAAGMTALAASEDRRNARLALVFGLGTDSLVWVTVQKKQRQAGPVLPARPRLALVAYDLPPENSRAWQALLRRTAVRTLIADQPLKSTAREVLVSLPLEPIGYPKEDPGPGTILLDDDEAQIRTKLIRFMKYAARPAGFAASYGSRALKDRRITAAVMKYCAAENLLFLEPRFTANSLAREAARSSGCRYVTATVYVEQKASAKSAAAALRGALQHARKGKAVLALFPARPDILAALDGLLTKQVLAEFDFVELTPLLGR